MSYGEVPFLTRLRRANRQRAEQWEGNAEIDTAFRALEVAGEVGELANLVKKLLRVRRGIVGNDTVHPETQESVLLGAIRREVGDVLITLDLLCMDLGIDLEAASVAKFNYTSEKIGVDVLIEQSEGWRLRQMEEGTS